MSGDLWLSALVSILIAAGGVGGTMYATRSARAQASETARLTAAQSAETNRLAATAQTAADKNLNYDQLQEDLTNLGARFDRYVEQATVREQKDAREIRYQGGIIRALDDELNEVRKMMTESGLTPPPRKPWPPYPGEWVEGTT